MDIRTIFKYWGGLTALMGALMLLPLPLSFWDGDQTHLAFLIPSAVAVAIGLPLYFLKSGEPKSRETLGIVALIWITSSALVGLPYLLSDTLPTFIDALFEGVSGLTTTGSSVLSDPELTPRSILFWRSLTQWLGGAGILAAAFALFSNSDLGSHPITQQEVTRGERISPRIKTEVSHLLWMYGGFTLILTVLLVLLGLSPFEAITHAFSTLSSGGFSIHRRNIEAIDNSAVHWVLILFMVIAATNFHLHGKALKGNWRAYFRNSEFIGFLCIILFSTTIFLWMNIGNNETFLSNLRNSSFISTSIASTTGFTDTNYDTWPVFSRYILILLMFMGGCTGSTASGLKIFRIVVILKYSLIQIFKLLHPKGVKSLMMDHAPLAEENIQNILGFFSLYMGIFLMGSLFLSAVGIDVITAGTSVLASLSNVGPGFGMVGPEGTFADMPSTAKGILSACMLLGRLEIFPMLVIFMNSYWRPTHR